MDDVLLTKGIRHRYLRKKNGQWSIENFAYRRLQTAPEKI